MVTIFKQLEANVCGKTEFNKPAVAMMYEFSIQKLHELFPWLLAYCPSEAHWAPVCCRNSGQVQGMAFWLALSVFLFPLRDQEDSWAGILLILIRGYLWAWQRSGLIPGWSVHGSFLQWEMARWWWFRRVFEADSEMYAGTLNYLNWRCLMLPFLELLCFSFRLPVPPPPWVTSTSPQPTLWVCSAVPVSPKWSSDSPVKGSQTGTLCPNPTPALCSTCSPTDSGWR